MIRRCVKVVATFLILLSFGCDGSNVQDESGNHLTLNNENELISKSTIHPDSCSQGILTEYKNVERYSTTSYNNCKKNGIQVIYYSSGNILGRYNWMEDTLNGFFEEFYESGNILTKGEYKHGFLHGEYAEFQDSAYHILLYSYFQNGIKYFEKNYSLNTKGEGTPLVSWICEKGKYQVSELIKYYFVIAIPPSSSIKIKQTVIVDGKVLQIINVEEENSVPGAGYSISIPIAGDLSIKVDMQVVYNNGIVENYSRYFGGVKIN